MPTGLSTAALARWNAPLVSIPSERLGTDALARWIALLVIMSSERLSSAALARRCSSRQHLVGATQQRRAGAVDRSSLVSIPSERLGSAALARWIAPLVMIPSGRRNSLCLRAEPPRRTRPGPHGKLSFLERSDEQLHRFEMKLAE
jgi:hypothetical protein